MLTDLFGEVRVAENCNYDDEALLCSLSFNKLKEELEVNVEEGWAKRRKDVWAGRNRNILAAKAGGLVPLKTYINGHQVWLHHIIWCVAHNGEWPTELIDHIDGDGYNNKISNLREVTRSQNNTNRAMHKNNKSGVTGVHWDSYYSKWRAEIGVNKKHIKLGLFDNFDQAVSIRHKAEDRYFGEYSRRASRGEFQYNGYEFF